MKWVAVSLRMWQRWGTEPWECGGSAVSRPVGQGLHRPSRHIVEKKAMLRVSRGLSCVHSGERVCGSDSPVNEELSTLQPWAWRILMSAGTRSPPFISTRSPTTS